MRAQILPRPSHENMRRISPPHGPTQPLLPEHGRPGPAPLPALIPPGPQQPTAARRGLTPTSLDAVTERSHNLIAAPVLNPTAGQSRDPITAATPILKPAIAAHLGVPAVHPKPATATCLGATAARLKFAATAHLGVATASLKPATATRRGRATASPKPATAAHPGSTAAHLGVGAARGRGAVAAAGGR
ncbi:hypothetical protein ACQPZJ_09835 [Actinoplanes sp. CA-054009]